MSDLVLTAYFYDARGCSLASPETLTGPGAYLEAVRLRDALASRRGVRVFLHTVEAP